jgi:diguanylate cyclase (GGDEF)-like protein
VQQSLLALERTHRESMLIGEAVGLLQACDTAAESEVMMERFGSKLFPGERGAIYLYRASRNLLELATGWGEEAQAVKTFPPEDCWALRRGRVHAIEGGGPDVYCRHLQSAAPSLASSICIPMMAQGEATGLLVLEGPSTGIPEATQRLASLAAEQIALAPANLQLREKLRDQAIRDPLTAMYNRRYFEETAARELLRAGESGSSVGVIMIDVDHFKRFNDAYGHEAGDAVLQRVGLTLQSHTRVEDVVCRYGGEEFVMLLPGLPGDAIVRRAEELRESVNELSVRFRGETVAKISISCGVSMFPDQGHSCAGLIDTADQALYRAKQAGRNRVEVAA